MTETKRAQHHVIERTSPKGPGQVFIGYCVLCGVRGLKPQDALRCCENVVDATEDEAFARAIIGHFPSEH